MKMSTEELAKSFIITYDEDKNRIDFKFVRESVGEENVYVQTKLIAKDALAIFKKFPRKKWNILVDTATYKVTAMTRETKEIYENLMGKPNIAKVAVLMDTTERQLIISKWIFDLFLKDNKKINLFTSKEKAEAWLDWD